MSIYPPPSSQQGSIFNPNDWLIQNDTGLSTDFLDANYLKYPVAQGSINLVGSNNIGITTCSDALVISGASGDNYIEFTDDSKQYTAFLKLPTNQVYTSSTITTNANGAIESIASGDPPTPAGDAFLVGGPDINNPQIFLNYNQIDNLLVSNSVNTNTVLLNCDSTTDTQLNIGGPVSFSSTTNIGEYGATTNWVSTYFPSFGSSNTFTNQNIYQLGNIGLKNLTSWVAPASPLGYAYILSLNNNLVYQTQNSGGIKTLATTNSNTFTGTQSFTGATITAPTQLTSDNSTNVATTAFAQSLLTSAGYALLNGNNSFTANQNFTGAVITAPTQSQSDNTTNVATTAYTQSLINTSYPNKTIFSAQATSNPDGTWNSAYCNTSIYQGSVFVNTPILPNAGYPVVSLIQLRVSYSLLLTNSLGAPPNNVPLSGGFNYVDCVINLLAGNGTTASPNFQVGLVSGSNSIFLQQQISGYTFTPISIQETRVGQYLIVVGFPAFQLVNITSPAFPTNFITNLNVSVEIINSNLGSAGVGDSLAFPNKNPGNYSWGGFSWLDPYTQ